MLARVPGGFAVMGDVQWLPCYCILLTNDPDVTRLTELPRPTAHAVPGKSGPPSRRRRAELVVLCYVTREVRLSLSRCAESQSWNIIEVQCAEQLPDQGTRVGRPGRVRRGQG